MCIRRRDRERESERKREQVRRPGHVIMNQLQKEGTQKLSVAHNDIYNY